MITTIDLSRTHQAKPMLSDVLVEAIRSVLSQGKKAYLYFNQRGASHCLICQECGHICRCQECDHVMRVHDRPKPHLACHLCQATRDTPKICDHCQSHQLLAYGSRIQSVSRDLSVLFPDATIARIEGAKSEKDIHHLQEAHIIIGTQVSVFLDLADVAVIGVILVEAELSVAEYDIEEHIYHSISYASRHASDIYLQTYDPHLPIVQDLSDGNYKSFFTRMLAERKKYKYPPYTQMVRITLEKKTHIQTKKLAEQICAKLSSNPNVHISYDADSVTKIGPLHRQVIIIRSDHLDQVIDIIRPDIIGNPGVRIEWR